MPSNEQQRVTSRIDDMPQLIDRVETRLLTSRFRHSDDPQDLIERLRLANALAREVHEALCVEGVARRVRNRPAKDFRLRLDGTEMGKIPSAAALYLKPERLKQILLDRFYSQARDLGLLAEGEKMPVSDLVQAIRSLRTSGNRYYRAAITINEYLRQIDPRLSAELLLEHGYRSEAIPFTVFRINGCRFVELGFRESTVHEPEFTEGMENVEDMIRSVLHVWLGSHLNIRRLYFS